MSYTAKNGRKFGNSQQGRKFDEVHAEAEAEPQMMDTPAEEQAETITCPHCGGELELHPGGEVSSEAAPEAKPEAVAPKGGKTAMPIPGI